MAGRDAGPTGSPDAVNSDTSPNLRNRVISTLRVASNSVSRTGCGRDLTSDQKYKVGAIPKANVPPMGYALSEVGTHAAGVTLEGKYYLWYI